MRNNFGDLPHDDPFADDVIDYQVIDGPLAGQVRRLPLFVRAFVGYHGFKVGWPSENGVNVYAIDASRRTLCFVAEEPVPPGTFDDGSSCVFQYAPTRIDRVHNAVRKAWERDT